ncbi:MAG: fluoride efflux transporter CrcB [bacterium]|jgi:CrcB protein
MPGPLGVWLAVAGGGALGALARFAVSRWTNAHLGGPLPFGTLLVNVLGSFLLGALATVFRERYELRPEVQLLLTTGFMGAFTTFSTFSLETWTLALEGAWGRAGLNLLANLFLSLLACGLGIWWFRVAP